MMKGTSYLHLLEDRLSPRRAEKRENYLSPVRADGRADSRGQEQKRRMPTTTTNPLFRLFSSLSSAGTTDSLMSLSLLLLI